MRWASSACQARGQSIPQKRLHTQTTYPSMSMGCSGPLHQRKRELSGVDGDKVGSGVGSGDGPSLDPTAPPGKRLSTRRASLIDSVSVSVRVDLLRSGHLRSVGGAVVPRARRGQAALTCVAVSEAGMSGGCWVQREGQKLGVELGTSPRQWGTKARAHREMEHGPPVAEGKRGEELALQPAWCLV